MTQDAARRAGEPPPATPAQSLDLDTAAIDARARHKGKVNGGVYQVSVPRAEPIADDGIEVPPAMGSADRDQLPADRRRQGGDHRRLRAHGARR